MFDYSPVVVTIESGMVIESGIVVSGAGVTGAGEAGICVFGSTWSASSVSAPPHAANAIIDETARNLKERFILTSERGLWVENAALGVLRLQIDLRRSTPVRSTRELFATAIMQVPCRGVKNAYTRTSLTNVHRRAPHRSHGRGM